MVTSFKSIFQVNLLHNFYTDGKCSDFVLFPLNETIDLLRNRQAVFRSKDNYIRTLILGDSSGPGAAVPLEKNESCYFGMRLITPSFSNITNEYPSDKKIFLFTNENNTSDPSAAAIALERKEIALCGPVINHTVVSAAGVTLKLKNVSGQVIQTKNYAAGSAGTNHQFDIQRLPKGLYTVTEDDGATTIYTYYADNDLVFDSVFGIIRIVNQPDFLFTYDGKPIYQVSFTSRSSLWNY
ncbi:MAG TPA: hypothetical protein VFU15_07145, partial [Bacteroidia bacterium]|nr:hypothetical protein [Bacteroidia bacterium]